MSPDGIHSADYPYSSGFESLEKTPLLTGNGCRTVTVQVLRMRLPKMAITDADEAMMIALREKMRLPLSEAKERCLQCHDQDNSPEYQHEGSFEKYWAEIAHPGKD